jgi:hypothetical protein
VRGLELEVGAACRGKRQQGRRARHGRRRQAQLHVLPRQAGVGAAQLALAGHRRAQRRLRQRALSLAAAAVGRGCGRGGGALRLLQQRPPRAAQGQALW